MFKMPKNKARFVQKRFGNIASHYDLFNDLITQAQHRRWKNTLVRLAKIRPSMRILDVCCGTGDLSLRACKQIQGQGVVIAADFSLPMLRITQHRLRRYQHTYTLAADALILPFANQTFDVVTIGYGLRNVSDPQGCLTELFRILKPKGRFACLDIGQVRYRWMKPLAHAYMFHIVPRIGKLLMPAEEMFDYLPHSTRDYLSQAQLCQLLQQVGFSSIQLKEYLFGTTALHIACKPPS